MFFILSLTNVEIQVQTPVVIVPSLINRHFILDLLPGKSLIEFMLQNGLKVYVLDWGVPRDEDRFLTFESLILNS